MKPSRFPVAARRRSRAKAAGITAATWRRSRASPADDPASRTTAAFDKPSFQQRRRKYPRRRRSASHVMIDGGVRHVHDDRSWAARREPDGQFSFLAAQGPGSYPAQADCRILRRQGPAGCACSCWRRSGCARPRYFPVARHSCSPRPSRTRAEATVAAVPATRGWTPPPVATTSGELYGSVSAASQPGRALASSSRKTVMGWLADRSPALRAPDSPGVSWLSRTVAPESSRRA